MNLIRIDDVVEDTELRIDNLFRRPTGKREKYIIVSEGTHYISNQFAEQAICKYKLNDLIGSTLKILNFKTTQSKKKIRDVSIIQNEEEATWPNFNNSLSTFKRYAPYRINMTINYQTYESILKSKSKSGSREDDEFHKAIMQEIKDKHAN